MKLKWKELNRYTDFIEELRQKGPYEILEIKNTATPEEIRQAYLKKVKIYHPDNSDEFIKINNENILKIINGAYETITSGP